MHSVRLKLTSTSQLPNAICFDPGVRSNYLECQQRNIHGRGRKIPVIIVTPGYLEGQKIELAVSFIVPSQMSLFEKLYSSTVKNIQLGEVNFLWSVEIGWASLNSAAEIPVTRKKNNSLVLTKRGTFKTFCLPNWNLNSQANFVFYRAKKRQEDGLLIPFTELLRIFGHRCLSLS